MKAGNLERKTCIFVSCMILFFSCRTVEKAGRVVDWETENVSDLIERINDNSSKSKSIEIKKIISQVETPDKKSSFRANLISKRDEFIIISINKLTVPVVKVLLTPDSIKLVNYIDKYWITDSYKYFDDHLNVGIKFETIQSVVYENILFNHEKVDSFASIDPETKSFILKDYNDVIVKSFYLNPANSKVQRIVLNNNKNTEKVMIDFSNFVSVGKQLYPGEINFDYSGENFFKTNLKLSGIEINKKVNLTFSIPGKYVRLE